MRFEEPSSNLFILLSSLPSHGAKSSYTPSLISSLPTSASSKLLKVWRADYPLEEWSCGHHFSYFCFSFTSVSSSLFVETAFSSITFTVMDFDLERVCLIGGPASLFTCLWVFRPSVTSLNFRAPVCNGSSFSGRWNWLDFDKACPTALVLTWVPGRCLLTPAIIGCPGVVFESVADESFGLLWWADWESFVETLLEAACFSVYPAVPRVRDELLVKVLPDKVTELEVPWDFGWGFLGELPPLWPIDR